MAVPSKLRKNDLEISSHWYARLIITLCLIDVELTVCKRFSLNMYYKTSPVKNYGHAVCLVRQRHLKLSICVYITNTDTCTTKVGFSEWHHGESRGSWSGNGGKGQRYVRPDMSDWLGPINQVLDWTRCHLCLGNFRWPFKTTELWSNCIFHVSISQIICNVKEN